jgi:signal transduction histidine kinase
MSPKVKLVTLRWQAALLFGGQLLLVGGGVIAMLLLQQAQQAAGASADSARHAQVLEAKYFAGMTQAESGLQEYIDTGDIGNLTNYSDGLTVAVAAGAALKLVNTDAQARIYLVRMFAESAAWQGYALHFLGAPDGTIAPNVGDDFFAAYTAARQTSNAYLETVVAKGAAAEAESARMELVALAAIGAFALVSIVSGGVLFYRSTLQPMGRLIRAARELAAGARTELPPSSSTGEIGDLSRALHAWQRSAEKRNAIAEAMHEVSSQVDRDEIVRMSLERLLEVSDAAEVGLVLSDETETTITTMTRGSSLLETYRLPVAEMEALISSRTSVVGDFRDDRWPDALRNWASERGHGPVVMVPMVSGSKSVGSIAALRSIGRPAFDAADLGLVEAIAGPLAAAIRVAGLFEEVRAVSAKLDLVNRHRTDFLSNMSHELRTPLNSILGFAELLVSPGFDTVTTKQARYIANIHTSGTHLTALLNDALDLAKVESGKSELELERVDVARLVAEVVALMQPLAVAAGVNLLTSAGRPGTILADRRKLHQVLLNLLSNAIKFTLPKGSVTMVLERTPDALLLTVVDTGIGVADEDQERIFGAFEQVSGANRDGGGTGLGLALSRQYVELHGGRIWMESCVGKGSSFHVELPVTGGPVRALEAAAVPLMAALLQK